MASEQSSNGESGPESEAEAVKQKRYDILIRWGDGAREAEGEEGMGLAGLKELVLEVSKLSLS